MKEFTVLVTSVNDGMFKKKLFGFVSHNASGSQGISSAIYING